MRKLLFSFFILVFIQNSNASVDFRLIFGKQWINPETLNEGMPEDLKVKSTNNLGFDLVINPSFLPIGLGMGARFESFSNTEKDNGYNLGVDASRLSMLINYRLINTGIYVGPIATYGLGHETKIKTNYGVASETEFTANKVSSFTIGAEAGARILTLLMGGELGYMRYVGSELMDGNGNYYMNSTGVKRDATLSGMYFKMLCGFSF